jgi:hypothetical protein
LPFYDLSQKEIKKINDTVLINNNVRKENMGATSFEIISRNLIGDDSLYKDIGQYEFITGRLYYSVDPKHPDSQLITDIDLISTNNKGEVEFSSDIQTSKYER